MATDAASAAVLERPGLRKRIRSALDTGSLLLIADAGFGKTTALQVALRGGSDAALVRCRDAGGRVTELDASELVCSAADCHAYLGLARGREPQPNEVDTLVEETQGWPLGVVLAVEGGSEPARAPSRDLMDAYFEEQVLGDLE